MIQTAAIALALLAPTFGGIGFAVGILLGLRGAARGECAARGHRFDDSHTGVCLCCGFDPWSAR